MNAIRFFVEIDDNGKVRWPSEVVLVPGQAEVIILQPQSSVEATDGVHAARGEDASGVPANWLLLQKLGRRAQELGISGLPPDLATHHDHYAHGAPKTVDDA